METGNYIKVLKKKSREAISVAFRQSLMLYLYKNGVGVTKIASFFGMDRRTIYHHIYHAMELLDCNDELLCKADEERKMHKITIKPIYMAGEIITHHAGYKLEIDNTLY